MNPLKMTGDDAVQNVTITKIDSLPPFAPTPEGSAAGSVTPRGCILIADDEPAFARPLAEVFRREGFEAEAVFDGSTARERLNSGGFDLLIADINMPGNPGLELVRVVSALPTPVPVILLTGSPTVQTAANAVQLGAVAYLLKPIDFDELLPVVEKAIQRQRTRQLARLNRSHLEQWLREAEAMEATLDTPGEHSGAAGDFVALTLKNLMTALLDFRRATELVHTAQKGHNPVWQANTLQALQKSIDVLERTRRNFKSAELRDLRHELQRLVDSYGNAAGNAGPQG